MSKMGELSRQTEADDIACKNSKADELKNNIIVGVLEHEKKKGGIKTTHQQKKTKDKKYNGWTNYETWNVMLWINNDMVFYHQLKEIIQENDGKIPYNLYEIFAMKNLRTDFSSTGDGVSLYNKKINKDEINEHLHEMFSNDDTMGEK